MNVTYYRRFGSKIPRIEDLFKLSHMEWIVKLHIIPAEYRQGFEDLVYEHLGWVRVNHEEPRGAFRCDDGLTRNNLAAVRRLQRKGIQDWQMYVMGIRTGYKANSKANLPKEYTK